MVRVIYLLHQSPEQRLRLLSQSVAGEPWSTSAPTGRRRRITDREMVDLSRQLTGWVGNVYRFGCSFIHLSSAHDYETSDPFANLPLADRREIASYINHYHHSHLTDESTFEEVASYVPKILEKISTNLEFELRKLEVAQI